MKWAAVPLVIIVALLLAGPTASAGTPNQTWKVEFVPAVLLGQFIQGNVTGPAGGTFTVYLYAEPFNDTVPIFNETFHLRANQTQFNVSVPTTLLTLGAYYLKVNGTEPSGNATLIYGGILRVLNPLNATQINEELYLLEQENLALEGQVQGLSGQISNYQFQADLLFWVFFTLFAVLLFKEGIQYYLRKRPTRLKAAREGWTDFWTQPNIHTFSGMPVAEARIITPQDYNPERRFVTGVGETPTQRRTREEMTRYLAQYGRLEPMEGKDYWVSEEAPPTAPRRTKEFEKRAPNFKVEGL
jgi:hypothetical protein